MAGINEEKYQNTILYLCSKLPGRIIKGKKKLAKLLYYVDFDRFEYQESMVSVTGDKYVRLPRGPVPKSFENVVANMEKGGALTLNEKMEFSGQQHPTVIYLANVEPDLSVFDEDELFILKRVANRYANLNGKALEDLSHREAPWLGVEHRDDIPFELAFYRGTDFSDAMRAA